MSNIELQRDHEGRLHLVVGGHFAVGAKVVNVQPVNDLGLCATVFVPLKNATIGEVRNVVPMIRPVR